MAQDQQLHLGPVGGLSQPTFEAGDRFSACDLEHFQQYRRQKLRRHLRYMHSAGVICGLNVVAAGDAEAPWMVRVCPGYGISPCGDEILFPEIVLVDLQRFLWMQIQTQPPRMVWLAICYAERKLAKIAAPGGECGCDEPVYRASRIADAWRFDLLDTVVPPPFGGFNICGGQTPPCPICPDTCDLVLASIQLPPQPDQVITDAEIHNVAFPFED